MNDKFTIQEARALAKMYGIKAEKTWKLDDFILAIKANQNQSNPVFDVLPVVEEEEDESHLIRDFSAPVNVERKTDAPPPGYARLLIHKDPMPGAANSAVQLGLNGRFFNVPRGKEVDLPKEYIEVLQNAVQVVIRQKREPTLDNPNGEMSEESMLTHPFQVVAITPGGGRFQSGADQRGAKAVRRQAFAAAMDRYPASNGELESWEESLRADKRAGYTK